MAFGRHRRSRRTMAKPKKFHHRDHVKKDSSISSIGSYSKPSVGRLYMANVAPDAMVLKLRYPQILTVSTGVLFFNSFRGNGPFDPDSTGGGQQPGGFDQWASLYSRYRVTSCSIELQIVNESPTVTCVTLFPTLTNATPSNYQNATVIPYKRQVLVAGSGGRNTSYIKSYMSTAKITGLTEAAILAEDDFQSPTGTLPLQEWFWGIFVNQLDATTALDLLMTVNLTYYIRFEDRIQLAIS